MTIMPPQLRDPMLLSKLKTPPLEQGDTLTRDEFESRYEAMPEIKKAELIGGVVYMPSPVQWDAHGAAHLRLAGFIQYYSSFTPGTTGADNATVRINAENEPQPDITLIIRPENGGRVTIDKYAEGSPELVVEIAASSVSIDMNQKMRVYQRNQVCEYLVHRVYDEAIDWFIHRNNQLEPLTADADGIVKSETFPGLWLDTVALLRFDMPAVFATLNYGLASPEHAAFVSRLRDVGPKS